MKGFIIEIPNNLVLFDGVCNLCNGTVKFLIRIDKKKVLKYSALQSVYSEDLSSSYSNLSSNRLDTVVFIKDKDHFYRSTAILKIFRELEYPWKSIYYLKFIPEFFRDYIYKIIAANRYGWFGKKDQCMIPTDDIKERFI